jgi:hypothetical protein
VARIVGRRFIAGTVGFGRVPDASRLARASACPTAAAPGPPSFGSQRIGAPRPASHAANQYWPRPQPRDPRSLLTEAFFRRAAYSRRSNRGVWSLALRSPFKLDVHVAFQESDDGHFKDRNRQCQFDES